MKRLKYGFLGAALALGPLMGPTAIADDHAKKTKDLTSITGDTFQCIRDMTAVRGFYVDNLLGDLDATLEVANSETGGVYPAGSLIQLVPGEAMIKREKGFDEGTKDWEFFELIATKDGTKINKRGTTDIVNRFDGNCLECHVEAEPQWDLVCEQDRGCDPIPLTPTMTRAIQKTDPRCAPTALTDEEKEGLQMLMEMMGG